MESLIFIARVAAMIQGITIKLYEQMATGRDAFNRIIVDETPVEVGNVLVAPATETEVLDSINLTGRKAIYILGIPKGDTHDWTDKKVAFFGQTFRTIGKPVEGIESMIPLQWNKKVRVEHYDVNANQASI